ncbi:MAG: PH domain-containing protein [Candidatus Kapaibacterium sp.]
MSQMAEQISEKRLHPFTLLYRLIVALPNAALPIIFILYSGDRGGDWVYIFISLFLGFFILPGILLNYFYFDYTITDQEVVIRSGVLSKKERHIKIDRIQNVTITQNFLHKLMRIAKVQLETAGDATTEGNLDSVSIADSERIREIIRNHQHEKSTTEVSSDGVEKEAKPIENEEENVIFSMSLWDTIKYGAVRFRPIVLVASAWIFSMVSQFNPNWTDELEVILESNYKDYIRQLDIFMLVVYAIAGVLLVLLLSWIIDILLTVNTYYKFKLVSDKGKLMTSQGLFSSQKGAIPLKKLQMMVIKSNPITRKLNFYRLDLQTAGFGGGDGTKAKSETAIPFAKFTQVKEIINKIRNVELPETFTKVSPKTIRRAVVKYLVFSIPFGVGLYFAFDSFWVLLTLVPIIGFGAFIRYQYRGYHVEDNQIIVKQGFWFQKISIIPIEKIQTLHKRSSYFQRRLGLATVEIDTAATVYGSDASIIDIDNNVATEIFEELNRLFIEDKNKGKVL